MGEICCLLLERVMGAILSEIIAECEEFGIPLGEFCELSLAAMQGIADDLGL